MELFVLTTSPLSEVSEMASNKLFSVPQGLISPPLHSAKYSPRYTPSDLHVADCTEARIQMRLSYTFAEQIKSHGLRFDVLSLEVITVFI